MYQAYCAAKQAADRASVTAWACYTVLVDAIVVRKTVNLNTVYGDWRVTTIWEGSPLAWRPRPLREYVVNILPQLSAENKAGIWDSHVNNPAALIAMYADCLQAESDAHGAEGAAYNNLIAAYLRGELSPDVRLQIAPDSAIFTGNVSVYGRVRCYMLKPAVEPAKKSRKK